MRWARPRPGSPRKGRPAALAASPFPQRATLREKGEGAQRYRGVSHFTRTSTGRPGRSVGACSGAAAASTRNTSFSRLPRL